LFLVPKGDQKLLNRKGIKNTREFLWWENIEIKGTKFTFTPTQHWSARGLADRNKSLWGGWFMSFPNFKSFHAGDSGYSKDFQDTQAKLGKPDLSLIPIGAYAPRWFMKANHVNPEEALQVALDLGSKKNYAMHWGTFQLTDEETDLTADLLKSLSGENTVVVIDHDMEFIRRLDSNVSVLNQGSVLCEGTMETIQKDQKVIDVYLGRPED